VSNRSITLDDRLYEYMLSVSLRESPLLKQLRQETAGMVGAQMQIAPEQGQFMAMLIKLTGARRALEIGTYSGYSALVCALALPEDGELITIDTSVEAPAVGRRYWEEAGLGDRVDFRNGFGADVLAELIDEGQQGTFDFVFIDADKTGYENYYELCLYLLKPGGLMLLDNVFWDGRVAQPENQEEETCAIRALNSKVHADPRVDMTLVPVGDGLTMVRKLA